MTKPGTKPITKPAKVLDPVKANAILTECIKKENRSVCPPSSTRFCLTQKDYISPKVNHVVPQCSSTKSNPPSDTSAAKLGSLPCPSSHSYLGYTNDLSWCRPHKLQTKPIKCCHITKFAEALVEQSGGLKPADPVKKS
ncbi:hypothetical protein GEMRC1_008567 [Eukaryota sp. GEM-RC1]